MKAMSPPVIHPADRLSSLPDEILAEILSLLSPQEAVRTCILARAWRHVWKFTRRVFIKGGDVEKVWEFVDRLLLHRLDALERMSIDECEITFHMYDDYDTQCIVEDWIRRFLECRVQELRVKELGLETENYLEISDGLLISQHLMRLELRGVMFNHFDLSLDGCHALEHLEIKVSYFRGVRKIVSPSLKHLVITECYDSNEDHQHIKICAPRLVSLWLEVGEFRPPILERMPELVDAHVRIDVGRENEEDYPEGCVLLEGLAQAKDLVLLAHHSTVELEYEIVWEGRPGTTAKSTMTTQCLKTVNVKSHTFSEGVQNVLKFLRTLNIWFQLGVTEGSP